MTQKPTPSPVSDPAQQPGPQTGRASDRPVGRIIDELDDVVRTGDLRLRDLVEGFGRSSFLPVMVVPALLVVSPLSGIPLFSSACGLTIVFVAAQMLWPGRDHLWLPDFLMDRTINGEKARKAMPKIRKAASWLDRCATGHGWRLMRRPVRLLLEALCLLCGAAMPFLEVVPFSSSILGFAVLMFSTALLTRDALFAGVGLLTVSAAVFVPLKVLGAI
ncbi:MAG: exopolysaccharide biosynthesis protein [Rhodobacteraceae bacterium]|nr:exopolysaccharide biosynthesis protein [Paracoccaceae bacterium]